MKADCGSITGDRIQRRLERAADGLMIGIFAIREARIEVVEWRFEVKR